MDPSAALTGEDAEIAGMTKVHSNTDRVNADKKNGTARGICERSGSVRFLRVVMKSRSLARFGPSELIETNWPLLHSRTGTPGALPTYRHLPQGWRAA